MNAVLADDVDGSRARHALQAPDPESIGVAPTNSKSFLCKVQWISELNTTLFAGGFRVITDCRGLPARYLWREGHRGGQVCMHRMTRYRVDAKSAAVGIPLTVYLTALSLLALWFYCSACNRGSLLPTPAWLPTRRRPVRSSAT